MAVLRAAEQETEFGISHLKFSVPPGGSFKPIQFARE